jgi:hypothetical protein
MRRGSRGNSEGKLERVRKYTEHLARRGDKPPEIRTEPTIQV